MTTLAAFPQKIQTLLTATANQLAKKQALFAASGN
jgi:hypothetical protein